MYGNAVLYDRDGAIGIVTLNRPEQLNAMNHQLHQELSEVLDEIMRDETRVAIFTGAGRAFSTGADIKEIVEALDTRGIPPTVVEESRVVQKVAEVPKVCIAAVNGHAAGGGCELALACDFRIAADTARFSLPEARLGVLPGAGGTQRLPRLVGPERAKWLMMTGAFVDAQTALQWGLVSQVVPAGALLEEARKLAQRLLEQAPRSLPLIKSAVDHGLDSSLASGLEYERRCSTILHQSEDKMEGLRAFVEKRKPAFKGR